MIGMYQLTMSLSFPIFPDANIFCSILRICVRTSAMSDIGLPLTVIGVTIYITVDTKPTSLILNPTP